MSKTKVPANQPSSTKDSYWEFVERKAAEVDRWPSWKLGGSSVRQTQNQTPKSKKDSK
jgi:hypothetical protein